MLDPLVVVEHVAKGVHPTDILPETAASVYGGVNLAGVEAVVEAEAEEFYDTCWHLEISE